MDKKQQERYSIFLECKRVFQKTHILFLQAAPRVGKSKQALSLMKMYPDEPWDIIVHSNKSEEGWRKELKKYNILHWLDNDRVIFYNYKSLHKYSSRRANIVLDEVQYLTELKAKFLTQKRAGSMYYKLIMLSAKLPVKKAMVIKNMVPQISKFNIVHYSLDKSVKNGLVAPYKIKVIEFSLDDQVKNIPAGTKQSRFYTTELSAYQYLSKRFGMARHSGKPNDLKFAALNRMHFIYNLPSKKTIALEVLEMLPEDLNVLVFTGSIKRADELLPYRYHNKTDSKHFNMFCEGKIKRLASVKGIKEGVTIPSLDLCLITQVTSNDADLIQQAGRAINLDSNNPDKVGHIIILCALGTQDEKWVRKALRSFDPDNIEYMSIKQVRKTGIGI